MTFKGNSYILFILQWHCLKRNLKYTRFEYYMIYQSADMLIKNKYRIM